MSFRELRTPEAQACITRNTQRTSLSPGPIGWSHDPDVATTMNPRGRVNVGWEEVSAGWERAAESMSDGQVSVEDLVVVPLADNVAYTLGREHGEVTVGGQPVLIDWRVTTIYRREGERWKVVHNHTDFSPTMVKSIAALEVEQGID